MGVDANLGYREGRQLKAALFTTYDRADERLLAEHLLPLLLRVRAEAESEIERQHFIVELDRRLKQLHDKIVVVSSTTREEPGHEEAAEAARAWIWRSIRHLSVGCEHNAVQHAKLWLLHWGAGAGETTEHLEIVVSSTNLTRSAFRQQLQAAWRGCIPLSQKGTQARLADWGVLPEFLRSLATSAGDNSCLNGFIGLLSRASAPEGVTFVASVPGRFTRKALRQTAWGAAGLEKITPSGQGRVSVSVLCPFVGSWSGVALKRWCDWVESSPERVSLIWIDKTHPWASPGRWQLPSSTFKAFTAARAKLLHLRWEGDEHGNGDGFHEAHRSADERWSHAKVYSLRRGNSRRLLVTSANFSSAAWGREDGDGTLTIGNFELGVCVEQASWGFDDLDLLKDLSCSDCGGPETRREASILWARAEWDGRVVDIACRCKAGALLRAELDRGDGWTPIPNWAADADTRHHKTRFPWKDSNRPRSGCD
ncbi:MAG: hypothetical protein IPP47_06920 [Bryobacterales bacterium]|nr:hypothetical protein [Bryobacterales bacterium]